MPADHSVGGLIVIGKYVSELKIGRFFFVCFCQIVSQQQLELQMHILAYSVLTVDWSCDYCGDSGKNNNSFTCSECFDCWSVLQGILEHSQAVQGLSRVYTLHRIFFGEVPESSLNCCKACQEECTCRVYTLCRSKQLQCGFYSLHRMKATCNRVDDRIECLYTYLATLKRYLGPMLFHCYFRNACNSQAVIVCHIK